MRAIAVMHSYQLLVEAELDVKVVPAVGKLVVSWQQPLKVDFVDVVNSVLQERRGEASEWLDVSAASDAEGRKVTNVKTTSRMIEYEEIHLRVVARTNQQLVTGEFAFDVLRSSSTCTKHHAATDLHPKVEMETGSSIVLKWRNGGVTLESADDGLRLHGALPLTVYLRCLTIFNDLNCQRFDSQGSVDDAEPSEGKLFKPVDLSKVVLQSPCLIELTKLGQGTPFETCCVIQLFEPEPTTYVITPSQRCKTFFGDENDFYDKTKELGTGGYGTVFKGWSVRRPLVLEAADTREERAIKVFGLGSTNMDADHGAHEAWQHEKEELKRVHDVLARSSSDALRCMIKYYSKVGAAAQACAHSRLD